MMRWLPIAGGGISILTTLALIVRDYPLVGHDYRYFIPRLVDTDLHLRLNGLSIQWYTPSFGSGIPAFPNPQHLEYSLVQALTFISNPWTAVVATMAIALAIGFWACFRIARTHLGLGIPASTLAALFFVSNGFVIEHAVVGHVGFQLFPLATVMLWTLIDTRWLDVPRGALLGLTIALTLYHGGGIVIILNAMTIGLCMPLLIALRPHLFEVRRMLRTSAVAALFSAAICAPKIIAGLMLMRQFPRQVAVDPAVPVTQALAGFVSQLAGVQVLSPLLAAMNIDPSRAYGVMVNLSGQPRLGVWELDTGLSPLLFVCLAIGAWSTRKTWPRLSAMLPIQRAALAILAIGLWIVLEATLGHGLIFPLLKTLPVVNTLHVNARFGAVLILPLALTAGVAIESWLADRLRVGALLVFAACIPPLAYFALPTDLFNRNFNVTASLAQPATVVDRLEAVSDAEALSIGASSLQPYDPLFGYGNESFTPETHAGDVRVASGGYWNMTHPAGLVFPAENGLRKFERIREDDRERLELFLQRRQPQWVLPGSIIWATRIAVPALVLCLFAIATAFWRGRVRE